MISENHLEDNGDFATPTRSTAISESGLLIDGRFFYVPLLILLIFELPRSPLSLGVQLLMLTGVFLTVLRIFLFVLTSFLRFDDVLKELLLGEHYTSLRLTLPRSSSQGRGVGNSVLYTPTSRT